MTSPLADVLEQQRMWARSRGICIDSAGYTECLSDNLIAPLSGSTRDDFRSGDGGELGRPGERGKMQALHSSSALAYNVFEHWRGRDAIALAAALYLSAPITRLQFEHPFSTGLPGNPPNLDVVLTLSDQSIAAIESKFLEPYRHHHAPGFKPKYFDSVPGEWARSGYTNCQDLAWALQTGATTFRWLHAEQLLKHVLGLARSGSPWELIYLWYAGPGPAASQHASEASEFAGVATADGIRFRSMTYQALFTALSAAAVDSERPYLAYLGARYFRAAG
jgi:hypothetical protein